MITYDNVWPRGSLAFNDPQTASGGRSAHMSAPQLLQHLYSLGASSPDISRLIYGLIRHDEDEQYLSTLQGSELTKLVDFLDEVRALRSVFHLVMKQIPQALGAISTADDVYRQCLRKLQAICGDNMTLPSSYTISGDLTRVGDEPVAFGGFADVWVGTHCSTKVCIKALRVTLNDDPTLAKVCIGTPFFRVHSRAPTVVILQRGRYVEEAKTPKRRLLHRCYNEVFANRIRVDAEWNPDQVRREQSGREPDWTGECFL